MLVTLSNPTVTVAKLLELRVGNNPERSTATLPNSKLYGVPEKASDFLLALSLLLLLPTGVNPVPPPSCSAWVRALFSWSLGN